MAKVLSKTQKKIDHNVRRALSDAYELFLGNIIGFQSLSHQADYSNFPASLLMHCVFDTDEHQQQACQNGEATKMQNLIQAKLLKVGVVLKVPKHQVIFDNNEARVLADTQLDG